MQLTLASGRRVGVHHMAEGPGRTIVLCHAAPGSGLFDPDPELTRERGITLIGVDRPGYGESQPPTPGEWADVPSAVADLEEVLREFGTTSVGVAGWSAGGRVALALAAHYPDLVDRVCVISTPAPDEDVPWMPDQARAGLALLRDLAADEAIAGMIEQLAPVTPADPRSDEALGLVGASPADEAALGQPGARDRLTEMMVTAFAQGPIGMAADIAGYCLRPWGFEPSDVRTKTLLLYGAADPLGGSAHGRWWQKQLPNARLEMVPEAGHLVMIPMWKRVLSFLAPDR